MPLTTSTMMVCMLTSTGALCLGPPTNVAGQALNSTAVQLTWDAPTNSGGMQVTAYIVTYQLGGDLFLHNQTFSSIVGNLEPGIEYTFSVSAQSSQGRCAMANITVTTPGRQPSRSDIFDVQCLHNKVCSIAIICSRHVHQSMLI